MVNEKAGKNATLYGRLAEEHIIKKLSLHKVNRHYDALLIEGDLFGMKQTKIEIKTAQIFKGEFMFTTANHIKLKKSKGYYILVYMSKKTILFCLSIKPLEIEKYISRTHQHPSIWRKNRDYFRIKPNFISKLNNIKLI